jgi:hypothetical protein
VQLEPHITGTKIFAVFYPWDGFHAIFVKFKLAVFMHNIIIQETMSLPLKFRIGFKYVEMILDLLSDG